MTKSDPDQRSPQETAKLRDETVRKMIKVKPETHADEMKKRRGGQKDGKSERS